MSRGRKIVFGVVGALVGLVLLGVIGLGITGLVLHRPLPEGTAGPAAEALADRLLDSVDHQAWARTGAVAWTFGGRRSHLWDRQRDYLRFTDGELTVWIDLQRRVGSAERAGVALEGAELQSALTGAWAAWANDSFWLNAVVKIRDEGTTRSLVTLDDGREALLVQYASGGVTPGDAYLWIPGPDGRPEAWRMWVQILPIGGLEVGWTGWTELPTGAVVATKHPWDLIGIELEMEDLRGAATLDALGEGSAFDGRIPE